MRQLVATLIAVMALLAACQGPSAPTAAVPASVAPFPATWTPTWPAEGTSTATLVVRPTPTWDGTPPPPSKAFVPRISAEQLDRATREKEQVTIIDGRTLAAYEQAHIPGGLQIPFEELAARGEQLDANALTVLYSWSPDEGESLEAAMVLYELGFTQVAVLEGGIQAWYAAGYLVEGAWLTPTLEITGPPQTVTPLTTFASVTATVAATAVLEPSGTPTVTLSVVKR
jgi:rhodanese-related sulfurtransferase